MEAAGIPPGWANVADMAATGGIVRMHSLDESVAGARVVPLRPEPPAVSQVPQSASELGPVSPELAMVDPELGRMARELLPDIPRALPIRTPGAATSAYARPAVVELRDGLERIAAPIAEPIAAPIAEPIAEPLTGRQPRRHRRMRLFSSVAGVFALGVLLTLLVGRETGPDQRQTQSVAAAVSPSEGTRTATEQPAPTKASTNAATTAATPTKPTTRTTPAAPPAATSKTTATPDAVHAPAIPAQNFVWAAAPNAAGYEFQLFQGGERVFRTRVNEPRFKLPGRWRQDGRPYALLPGTYRWFVWPVSKATKRPSKVATVKATLVVKQQPS